MGARPLRRVIQHKVEDRLSDALLAKQFNDGDEILVDYDPETNEILLSKSEENPTEPEAALRHRRPKVIRFLEEAANWACKQPQFALFVYIIETWLNSNPICLPELRAHRAADAGALPAVRHLEQHGRRSDCRAGCPGQAARRNPGWAGASLPAPPGRD